MSSDLGQFLEACGANGPPRLEWDDWETGRINLEMKATGAGLAPLLCTRLSGIRHWIVRHKIGSHNDMEVATWSSHPSRLLPRNLLRSGDVIPIVGPARLSRPRHRR